MPSCSLQQGEDFIENLYMRQREKPIQNKIRPGQNIIQNDTKCNNYTPRMSDRPI